MQKNTIILLWYKRKDALLLWSVIFIAAIIRIYKLGDNNLWYDEVCAYSLTTMSYGEMFRVLFAKQFFSYYVLMKSWISWFGMSELSLRFLSMSFGVISVIFIYKIGKLLFNSKVALISSFLLAISPIHVWYSQEARGYGLSIFITLLIIYFFVRVLKENKTHLWTGLILSSLIAININYFCLYAIIITLIVFSVRIRRHSFNFKWGLIYLSLIPVCLLLLTPRLIKYIITLSHSFWLAKPKLDSIRITLENFNIGYNATPGIYFITAVVFFLLFILGLYYFWKGKRNVMIFLLCLIFLPIIITFLLSQFIPIYLDRNLILYSPFYYMIIAAGICKIKHKSLRIVVIIIILFPVVLCLRNYFSYYMPVSLYHHIGVHVKKPVEPAVDYISKTFVEGDMIGYSCPSSSTILYYIQNKFSENIDIFSFVILSRIDPYWLTFKGKYINGYTQKKCVPIFLDNEESYKRFKNKNFKRLWLISSSWGRDGTLDPHTRGIKKWMQDHYSILESKEFDGIFIDLYGKIENNS